VTHPRRQVVLVTHPLATIGGANEQGVSDGVRWSFDLRDDGVDSSYQPRPPLKAESCAGVHVLGSHLMDIHGVGPVGAARILADVGDHPDGGARCGTTCPRILGPGGQWSDGLPQSVFGEDLRSGATYGTVPQPVAPGCSLLARRTDHPPGADPPLP